MFKLKNEQSFTLVELLIVIGIIAVLARSCYFDSQSSSIF